jgi:hypothetical protein
MIPDDAPHGMAIRWIGEPYSDELGEHGEIHAEVRPGDLGTFIDFDGPPGDPEVVVTFPSTGAFVTPQGNVEPTSREAAELG